MIVSKKKYNVDMASMRAKISNLELVLRMAVGEKTYDKALNKVEKITEKDRLENMAFDYEEMPLSNPLLDDNKLPPRSEYNERLETAIKLFQDRHPVSDVAVKLAVAKKTARRYLRIAISKRKIKKADFDELNQ